MDLKNVDPRDTATAYTGSHRTDTDLADAEDRPEGYEENNDGPRPGRGSRAAQNPRGQQNQSFVGGIDIGMSYGRHYDIMDWR